MAPPRVDKRIESLILKLRNEEKLNFSEIAARLHLNKGSVWKIYKRLTTPGVMKTGGKPRCTDQR